jgi:hypothetical protein
MRKLILKGEIKMNKDIKSKIEEYVLQELENLKQLKSDEDGYNDRAKNGVSRIDTLVNLLQKDETIKNDLHLETRKIDCAEIKNNSEVELKKEELNIKSNVDVELKYDRWIKVGCEVAKVAVPIIFYNAWMKKGFQFEETGTYTSNTFRNLFGRFKPTE